MSKKLYVGNLSYTTSDDDLKNIFSQFGDIVSAKVITDRDTGRSKGFAFVEMTSEDSASAAIEKLDGTDQEGRTIKVNLARPQAPRDSGERKFRSSRY